MKQLLFFFLVFVSLTSNAKNYYFSSLSGDDKLNTGISPLSPFKSITQANLIMALLNPGDSVLFKRGETFYGQLNLTKGGTTSLPVVIGAYGTGSKPLITEFTTVVGFISIGTNIWESAAITGGLSRLNMVTINGVETGMGVFPDTDAPNGGWLTIDTVFGTSAIKDLALTGSWAGAELVMRAKRYIINRDRIDSQKVTKIYYTPTVSGYTPAPKFGYKIQNHPSTLTKNGEWYYNPSTQKIRIYSNTGAPTGVKVSTQQNCINSNNKSNIKIVNIATEGSNDNNISLTGGTNLYIDSCRMVNSGNCGVWTNATFVYIRKDTIITSYNNGIETMGLNNVTISNNYIYNTSTTIGMGQSGEVKGNGIAVKNITKNAFILNNTVIKSGYCNIWCRSNADTIHIANNTNDSSNLNKDDGGSIYTWSGSAPAIFKDKYIRNNIVTNSIGAALGTDANHNSGYAVYFDVYASDWDVSGNLLQGSGRAGIFGHAGNQRLIIHDNTIYDNGKYMGTDPRGCQIYFLQDNSGTTARVIKNNRITRNTIISVGGESLIRVDNSTSVAAPIGVIDSNTYVNYTTKTTPFTFAGGLSFTDWKALTNSFDVHSIQRLISSTDVIQSLYTTLGSTFYLTPYSWTDAKNTSYTDSVVLSAHTSLVLLRGTITNTHPTVSLTSPTNGGTSTAPATISLAATASDADGTITSVKFYNGTKLLGVDNTSPYTFSYTGVPVGGYSFTAHASDNTGDSTISSFRTYTVTAANTPPVVSITVPNADTSVLNTDSVQIKVSATDADGTVISVKVFDNSIFVRTITISPYQFNMMFPTGVHFITAKAFDNSNDSSVSSIRTITSLEPTQPLKISLDSDTILCHGGSTKVYVDATGGIPPYSVDFGEHVESAGTYQFIVNDFNGNADTGSITIPEPPILSLSVPTIPTIPYLNVVSVSVTATGGTPIYQYRVNSGFWQPSNTFNLSSGNYIVDVKDKNNCTTSISFSIVQLPPPDSIWVHPGHRKFKN